MTRMAPSTSALDLGAHLRAVRRDRGLTQADVARAAGVSRAFVVDLEGGRRAGAELSRVLAVARALGLGIDLVPYERSGFDDALDALLGRTP
jgi:transcriptional regulator with XRE-family HTH domain